MARKNRSASTHTPHRPTSQPANETTTPAEPAKSTESTAQSLSESDLANRGALANRIVGLIERSHSFALDSCGQTLHVYLPKLGRYDPIGRGWVRNAVREVLSPRLLGAYSITLVDTVFDLLQAGKPVIPDCPKPSVVVVENGVLKFDQATIDLIPHQSSLLATCTLPVSYQPDAICPAWLAFLGQILDTDDIPIVWEVIGSCLTADRLAQEAVWFYGLGGNGKSTLIMAIQGLLGAANCAAVSLKSLADNRFSAALVHRRLMAYDMDASPHELDDSRLFKSIVAGDSIMAEEKFQRPFEFRPYCTMLLAGNTPPASSDHSRGMVRRVVILPFGRFSALETNDGVRRQDDILQALASPTERSGALNLAILGRQRLQQNGRFTQSANVQAITSSWRGDHEDPFEEFFDECVDLGPSSHIPCEELLAGFNSWAKRSGHKPVTATRLGMWLRMSPRFSKTVEIQRIRQGLNRRIKVYQGIRLRSAEDSD